MLTMYWFQSFLRAQQNNKPHSSVQDTENHSRLHGHSKNTEKQPENPTSLSYWQVCLEDLIGLWVLDLINLKCASGLGPDLVQISGVYCTSLAFEPEFQEDSHTPPKPSERIHHSISGYTAACFSPLWEMILHLLGPDLNFILPVIKMNSLHSPFLRCSGGINLTHKGKGVQAIYLKEGF